MEPTLGLFLLSAVGISLTGVMLPGPMTAATVAKGYSNRHAGAWIGAGHGVVEILLIAAIYLGLNRIIDSPQVTQGIYLAGGLMMLYLGLRMFRATGREPGVAGGLPSSAFVTGIVITATNPAFYIWWATVGLALIATASSFGYIGIVLLAAVHVPCDLIWSEFISAGTFQSRRWWTPRVQRIVFGICALVLAGFGVWFCLAALL
jgi:threonine/homoserine/homoserine lactone efflux protein